MILSALLLLFCHNSLLLKLRSKCFGQDNMRGTCANFSPRTCFQAEMIYPLEKDGTSEIFKSGMFDGSQ